jgi:excisionase family DNA binding protein
MTVEDITMDSTVEITALTIEEAAPRLKIAPKTLRKWLREGAFPGVKVGRKWLVQAAEVEHAITAGRRGDHPVWVPPHDASAAPAPEDLAPTMPLAPVLQHPAHRKAEVVGRLRAMKTDGLSLQAIANQLNAEGVPTLSGKGRWQKGTIGDLLAQAEG